MKHDDARQLPDHTRLAQFVAEVAPAPPLFVSVSGAHLYGFASPDSDVDLRGAYVAPVKDLLGLRTPKETVSVTRDNAGVELDFVAHEVRKYASMMLKHNGLVLEQLFSPLVVTARPELAQLRELGKGCITRGLLHHYRGFAHSRRKLLATSGATVKHLLYAYRVYLSGMHALRSGEIEANLLTLNKQQRLTQVDELIDRKRQSPEKHALELGETAKHEQYLDELEAELRQAHEQSSLPDQPTTADELDVFVRQLRTNELRSDGLVSE